LKDSDIYQRGGCEFYHDCLSCPFPDCLNDTYRSVLSELRGMEARELARGGKTVAEIAKTLNISRMQVYRHCNTGALTTS